MTRRLVIDISSPALVGALVVSLAAPALGAQGAPGCAPETATGPAPALHCITLIPTKHSVGATGVLELTLAQSPFGVAVTEDGRYIYDIKIELRGLRGLRPAGDDAYVAWVATPNLERRKKLGVIGEDLTVGGQVDWNRFLVVVTAESSPDVEEWAGAILFSATSPSGWLSTMAGEPIFGNNELPVRSRYCLVNKC